MKNKYIEALKKKSKKFSKTSKNDSNWNHQLGIKIYHVYDGTKTKGWWDDVAFMKGSQQITVWWIHPRMKYSDECDAIAYEKVSAEKQNVTDNLLDRSTPNYVYLGKNKKRKKIVSYTLKSLSEDRKQFSKRWKDETEKVLTTGDVSVECHMKVAQYEYCRGVSICYPIEVIDHKSLKELTDFVNMCLDDPSLFSKTHSDYKYTKDDWNLENPVDTV
jgi:hypothetical protein